LSAPIHSALVSYATHSRRGPPAVLWLVLGLGLGVSIVLAALLFAFPEASRQRDHDKSHEAAKQPDVRIIVVQTRSDGTSSSATVERAVKRPALPAEDEREVRLAGHSSREQIARGGDGVKTSDDATLKKESATTPRWKSNKPPPIGDPEDDSPGIGLMLRERVVTRKNEPTRLAGANGKAERTEGNPAGDSADKKSKAEIETAVKALEAAGIKCEKDSQSGQVTRIDGSFRMTNELMKHVAQLRGVVVLKLSFSDVTDEGLAHVKDLSGLEELILNETKVGDEGVAHLVGLGELAKLDLEKTAVSDKCLAQLKTLAKLEHVDLRKTAVTPSKVKELAEALPEARIRS
jgi:hypothetical protein